jgi:uncharacterized delta-60 repeat protein
MITATIRNRHVNHHFHRPSRVRRPRVVRSLVWDLLEDRRLLNAASLDPTFGNGGVTTTNFPLHFAFASATSEAIDSSGRIVVAGYSTDADGDVRVVLARYTANGSLDSSFGDNGLVYTPIVAYTQFPEGVLDTPAVAIDPDGRIVVAGEGSKPAPPNQIPNNCDFGAARFFGNGRIDPSFGDNGLVTLAGGPNPNLESSDIPSALAIAPGGTILIGGTTDDFSVYPPVSEFAVAGLLCGHRDNVAPSR